MNRTSNSSIATDKITATETKKIDNNLYTILDSITVKFKNILEWLSIIFLFIQIVVVVYVVFGRFVLNRTPVWGEEIALLSMVWLSLFSVVIAEMNSAHINISLIDKILSDRAIRIRNLTFHLMNAIFSVVLTIEGFKLVFKIRHAVMPGSKLPVWFLYLSVPVSSIFLLLAILKKIAKKEA